MTEAPASHRPAAVRDSAPPTIAALASGRGRAGVAVIRVSGSRAGEAACALGAGRVLKTPRQARLVALRHPESGELLDHALVLWFPAPRSYTGEDVVEFHVHGGPAVIAAVLDALTALPGVRLAEPGEFTRRAFEHGRMDLAAAEGLLDLVAAETEAQRRQALAQTAGLLGARITGWQEQVLDAAARIEALLDFADEEIGDEDDIVAAVDTILARLGGQMASALADAARGRRIREGLKVVILGPPNAGKSTLLNALAAEDVAIVSPEPGTTRDAITVRLDLAGVVVAFVDTAGLRAAAGAVEEEGIRRAHRHAREADLALWLVPADEQEDIPPPPDMGERPLWHVRTKQDLVPDLPAGRQDAERFVISARTGAGMDALLSALGSWVEAVTAGPPALVTRRRQEDAVAEAREALAEARAQLAAGDWLLAAEALRRADAALGRITGRGGVEEMLDRLFAEFCIGK
ncbi:MAG: tRNA uridine-5-carboxymethylaminomethyl(34) synthesis GTPase MnmE [Alphaproteobacteria bacterium]|nr:MAG: tRNA uridine-5-carboxymethylaminomethyl(34) synthesis GTPase MnmE [Alphaproteobacteria bacterium]